MVCQLIAIVPTDIAEQPLIVFIAAVDLQTGYGVAVAVKLTSERCRAVAYRHLADIAGVGKVFYRPVAVYFPQYATIYLAEVQITDQFILAV